MMAKSKISSAILCICTLLILEATRGSGAPRVDTSRPWLRTNNLEQGLDKDPSYQYLFCKLLKRKGIDGGGRCKSKSHFNKNPTSKITSPVRNEFVKYLIKGDHAPPALTLANNWGKGWKGPKGFFIPSKNPSQFFLRKKPCISLTAKGEGVDPKASLIKPSSNWAKGSRWCKPSPYANAVKFTTSRPDTKGDITRPWLRSEKETTS